MSERRYGRRWATLRDRVLRERDWTCESCGKRSYLSCHLHHKTYERFGDERDDDLEVLCRSCHVERHWGEVGGVGVEPTQREAPGLQPGPALQLRRPPIVAIEGYTSSRPLSLFAAERLASPLVSMRVGFEPPFPESDAAERPGTQQSESGQS